MQACEQLVGYVNNKRGMNSTSFKHYRGKRSIMFTGVQKTEYGVPIDADSAKRLLYKPNKQ